MNERRPLHNYCNLKIEYVSIVYATRVKNAEGKKRPEKRVRVVRMGSCRPDREWALDSGPAEATTSPTV